MEHDIVLELNDITKIYPGVIALDNLSMRFRKGEVHAIVGENGAGKSTLIKAVSGAIEPDEGTIKIFGQCYDKMTPKTSRQNGVEVIYQEFNLIDGLTVSENVCLGEETGRFVSFSKLKKRTNEIFEMMNVNINPDVLVKELPTAHQQLVEIAKAISKESKILIMDEPTAPLTVSEVESLFSIIAKLKAQGITIIYISHRMEEIFSIADRVSVMRDGLYIDTLNIKDTDRSELIKLMVGRELKEDYPKRSKKRGEKILELKNICGNGDYDINLSLHKGEILGVAGLVGAGRTELARIIFGADKIESGNLFLNGKSISIKSPRHAIKQGIGLIPEDRKHQGCFLENSIDWNISISNIQKLSKKGIISEKAVQKQANKYSRLLGIKTPSIKQVVNNLSGGNQQKVAIAKVLATESDVLIFDEPTRGIDVGAKQEIYKLMNEQAEQQKAILMISSDMEELLGMSDRIVVLAEGKLVGEVHRDKFSQKLILELASAN